MPSPASASGGSPAVPVSAGIEAPRGGPLAPPGPRRFTVHGATLEITLVPDKTRFMLGEPIDVSFRVRNLSKEDRQTIQGGDTINRWGRPENFSLTALDGQGNPVPGPAAEVGVAGGNSLRGPQKIPALGEWTRGLFLPDWLVLTAPGRYRLTCQHRLPVDRAGADWQRAGEGDAVAVEVSAEIEVLPPDPAALGAVIDEYGQAMQAAGEGGDGAASKALRLLAWIDDGRVIPYFVKTATSRSEEVRMSSYPPLARFRDDRALAAIVAGVRDPVDRVQFSAAIALSRSVHPGAFEALWAAHDSPNEAVRLTVVHALGADRSPASLPRLRAMTGDRSAMVSGEAKRYEALRRAAH